MAEDKIVSIFESIGIPRMQVLVYLDLLKNKESTATQISKRTKMHRANVYDTLTKLKERNLVYFVNREGKQLFIAMPADILLHEHKEILEELRNAVEYLQTTYLQSTTPHVYVLEGLNAVKSIFFGLIEKYPKGTIWMYGLAEKENAMNLLNDKLMNFFHLERIKKHIELRLLFYKEPYDEMKALTKIKFTEARLLPIAQQSKTSQITQIVCDKKVYITLWIHPIYTIVIDSEDIAKEYADLYSILWELSKKVE